MAEPLEELMGPLEEGEDVDAGPPLQGALAQADPVARATERLGALSAEMGGVDQLRTLGARLIPDASEIAAQRARRRVKGQEMIDAYLQRSAQPMHDPLQRLLTGFAGAPRGSTIAQTLALGLGGAEEARTANRQMAAAREAAAARAGYEMEGAEARDLSQDTRLGVDLLRLTTPKKVTPKSFPVLVNEILERRNQHFDKLTKVGLNPTNPKTMPMIEGMIDREVAPLVKAIWTDYPQHREMLREVMPRLFATYPDGKGEDKLVTPAITGAVPTVAAATKVRTGEVPAPPSAPGEFSDFLPVKAEPSIWRDKAGEKAREANAKAATKYYDEVVRPGADASNSMLNAVEQLRKIGPNTSALLPARRAVGQALDAIGVKDAFGLVDDAIKAGQSDQLLQQMANAILVQAKGVQTEGDAQRAFKQGVQLADPKAAFDYKLRALEAAAWRLRYRQRLFDEFKVAQDGNYDGATASFQKFEEATPFVKMLSRRDGSQVPRFFHEFIQQRQRVGRSLSEAIKEWQEQ